MLDAYDQFCLLLNTVMPNQMKYYGSFHLARVLTLQSCLTKDLT